MAVYLYSVVGCASRSAKAYRGLSAAFGGGDVICVGADAIWVMGSSAVVTVKLDPSDNPSSASFCFCSAISRTPTLSRMTCNVDCVPPRTAPKLIHRKTSPRGSRPGISASPASYSDRSTRPVQLTHQPNSRSKNCTRHCSIPPHRSALAPSGFPAHTLRFALFDVFAQCFFPQIRRILL